jgi:glutamine amidotransferase
MSRVAIIDYGSGNLRSAAKAFEREAAATGVAVEVTADPDRVASADRIVLPGVGAFADCRAGVEAVAGLTEALTHAVVAKARPFLGICVGMQLMASEGREHGVTPGFGWIAGAVDRIRPNGSAEGSAGAFKVPHMGWNTLDPARVHPVLAGIPLGPGGWHAYFVHSYQLVASQSEDMVARTDYGGPITAAVGRANLFGTQFHPEKSQRLGLKLIANFLAWAP